MIKKLFFFTVLGILVFGLAAAGFSAGKGNFRKGKYTYKKTCRSCHDGSGSQVNLSPDSKTQKQWSRLFEGGKYSKLACKDEWEKISEADRLDIFSYLYKFAYDSPTPAKCK